jgi:hypothetical protein
MYTDIENIIKNKKLKTKFDLEFYDVDTYIYLNIITKSTYYIGYNFVDNDSSLDDGMLHRNIVLSNVSKCIKVFKLLNVKTDIMKNTIKLMMCLSQIVSDKKIIVRSNGKYKCDFYIKLNLITNLNYADRLYINFSQVEMKNFSRYIVGESYLTLSSLIKRGNHQLLKNSINCDAVIKLAKQPIYINFLY